jgi:phage virion morphogenesis protein
MTDISIRVDDEEVNRALRRLIRWGQDMSPVTRAIAALGANTTRRRFRTQTGPEGQRWKPSLRVQIAGGRTLTQDGHLRDSISSRSSLYTAQWGVNRIYAAIHQFGGKIEAKNAKALRFRGADGGFVVRKAVTMPARPYLGLSDDDRADILDLIKSRLATASGGAAQ